MAPDEVLATAAASKLGLVRSDNWPLIAAHLLACGHDGPDVLALACLGTGASGWKVDQLLPGALQDVGAPDMSLESAGDIVARLLAQPTRLTGDFVVVRTLARLAPGLDYPGGVIGMAYALEEWLDCNCHRESPERAEAEAFERELRNLPPLHLPRQLADALIS